jgi:arsenite methyltransferase
MTTSERKGEYGYDGSFHTISAGGQLAGVGAVSAALFAGAGFALTRRNRLAAALAAASALEVLATAASYV